MTREQKNIQQKCRKAQDYYESTICIYVLRENKVFIWVTSSQDRAKKCFYNSDNANYRTPAKLAKQPKTSKRTGASAIHSLGNRGNYTLSGWGIVANHTLDAMFSFEKNVEIYKYAPRVFRYSCCVKNETKHLNLYELESQQVRKCLFEKASVCSENTVSSIYPLKK